MNSKKSNPRQDSNVSHESEETNELNKLVKKTKLQNKVLKKMIEEIKKSSESK